MKLYKKKNALSWIWTNGFLLIKQTLYPWVISATKVVGIEPTMLILKTSVLPIKLYLLISLVWELNPRQRIKSPLHCHYANQGHLLPHWKWWDLNPFLLYAKQMFYLLYYIPIGRGGIWTHELNSQDLASLHNNHSVTRLLNFFYKVLKYSSQELNPHL